MPSRLKHQKGRKEGGREGGREGGVLLKEVCVEEGGVNALSLE
jgi:hypothetical protein